MNETVSPAEAIWRSQRTKWTWGFLVLSMAASSLMNWISSIIGLWFVEVFAEPADLAVFLEGEQLNETKGILLIISLVVTAMVAFRVTKGIYDHPPVPKPRYRLDPPATPQISWLPEFWLPTLIGAGTYWFLFSWIFSLGMQVANVP